MKYNGRSLVKLTAYCLFVVFGNACAVFAENEKLPLHEKLTAYDLNRKLLAFSDNYQESISETIDEIMGENVSPTERVGYQGTKVFYTNSAIDIVTESDAIKQLMDMMVMVRLQRIVWNNGGHDFSIPSHAARLSSTLGKLEKDLTFIASQVFTQETINTIQSLADEWQRENPDRNYIAFVRFQDFAHSKDKAAVDETIRRDGFFATISDANQQIEETRFAFERAMFLANHIPIILEWQAELFLYKLLSTGEIKDLIVQSERLTSSAERISLIAERLPAEMQDILESNQKPLENITGNIAMASENFKVIAEYLSPLFEEKDSEEKSEIDLQQIGLIVEDVRFISKELARISETMSNFSYGYEGASHLSTLVSSHMTEADNISKQLLIDLDERLERHREFIFYRLLILIVAFNIIFFASYVIAKRHVISHSKNSGQIDS